MDESKTRVTRSRQKTVRLASLINRGDLALPALVRTVYLSLTLGCGAFDCENPHCYSSSKFKFRSRSAVSASDLGANVLATLYDPDSRVCRDLVGKRRPARRGDFSVQEFSDLLNTAKSQRMLKKLVTKRFSGYFVNPTSPVPSADDLSVNHEQIDLFMKVLADSAASLAYFGKLLSRELDRLEAPLGRDLDTLRFLFILLAAVDYSSFDPVLFEKVSKIYCDPQNGTRREFLDKMLARLPAERFVHVCQRTNNALALAIFRVDGAANEGSETVCHGLELMWNLYYINKHERCGYGPGERAEVGVFYNFGVSEVLKSEPLDIKHLDHSRLPDKPLSDQRNEYPYSRLGSIPFPPPMLLFPHAIPIHDRQTILDYEINFRTKPFWYVNAEIRIRREQALEDLHAFLSEPSNVALVLMERPVVKFVGESGIDQGGVKKELFQIVAEEMLKPDLGLFRQLDNNFVVLNWTGIGTWVSLDYVRVCGAITGLALMMGVYFGIPFPRYVYKKLLGQSVGLEDLRDVNADLFNSLVEILEYDKDDLEEVFLLDFSVTEFSPESHKRTVVALIDGGENIAVTQDNKEDYVRLVVNRELVLKEKEAFESFSEGFHSIMHPERYKTLKILDAQELEFLMVGSTVFDFDSLVRVCRYSNGYNSDSKVVQWLWDILRGAGLDKQKAFLAFVTGSDRVPIGGLSNLKLTVVKSGGDTDNLPTSTTCFNLFLLPNYKTRKKLKEKLYTALENSKGFGLK